MARFAAKSGVTKLRLIIFTRSDGDFDSLQLLTQRNRPRETCQSLRLINRAKRRSFSLRFASGPSCHPERGEGSRFSLVCDKGETGTNYFSGAMAVEMPASPLSPMVRDRVRGTAVTRGRELVHETHVLSPPPRPSPLKLTFKHT